MFEMGRVGAMWCDILWAAVTYVAPTVASPLVSKIKADPSPGRPDKCLKWVGALPSRVHH